MNREQLIEKAAKVLFELDGGTFPQDCTVPEDYRRDALAVLDAILPQVTTAEQLDEYPDGTLLLAANGRTLTLDSPYLTDLGLGLYLIPDALERYGPFTVVWQPS